ncbi:unnamed protein product [Camellia sinensis]
MFSQPHFHAMTMHGYRAICKAFQELTNKVHDVKQLQNKYALLKRDWQLWSRLMDIRHGPTGISYNEATGLIQASDDWWAHYEKIKTKLLKHMDLMRRVYEGATENLHGHQVQRSNLSQPGTVLCRWMKKIARTAADDTPVTVHVALSAIHADDTPTSGGSKRKFSRTTHPQQKKGQSERALLLASSMDNLASSVKLQQRQVRVHHEYGDSTQELVGKCMARLYSLEGLDPQDPLIVFGLTLMDNPANEAILLQILTDAAVISWL